MVPGNGFQSNLQGREAYPPSSCYRLVVGWLFACYLLVCLLWWLCAFVCLFVCLLLLLVCLVVYLFALWCVLFIVISIVSPCVFCFFHSENRTVYIF